MDYEFADDIVLYRISNEEVKTNFESCRDILQ